MRLVLLEDDSSQSAWLKQQIESMPSSPTIDCLTSESEFRAQIDAYCTAPPDLFVLDVMVRWTKPAPVMAEPPDDAKTNGYFRAGFRCAKLLRDAGVSSPIIFYTILENTDVNADLAKLHELNIKDATYLRKARRSNELLKMIGDILRRSP